MMSSSTAAVGPNFSSDPDNFFQSDRDIAARLEREAKRAVIGTSLGAAISLPSKVLHFVVDEQAQGANATTAFAAGSWGGVISVNLSNGEIVQRFKGHAGPVTCVQIATIGNEKFLFSGSWDKTVRKWRIANGELISTYEIHSDFVKCLLATTIAGKPVLFTGSSDALVRMIDLETDTAELIMKGARRGIEDLCVDDASEFLYAASSDSTIRKFNIADGSLVCTLDGHLTSVYCLLFIDESFYSGSADKTVRRWDLTVWW